MRERRAKRAVRVVRIPPRPCKESASGEQPSRPLTERTDSSHHASARGPSEPRVAFRASLEGPSRRSSLDLGSVFPARIAATAAAGPRESFQRTAHRRSGIRSRRSRSRPIDERAGPYRTPRSSRPKCQGARDRHATETRLRRLSLLYVVRPKAKRSENYHAVATTSATFTEERSHPNLIGSNRGSVGLESRGTAAKNGRAYLDVQPPSAARTEPVT